MNNPIIYSAGVLPYCINNNGTILFLLGKDYDNKWSDFGGRCEIIDKGDKSLTASREYWEETLGCICDLNYSKKIVKKSKHVESKTYMGYPYYMYLVRISHREDFKNYFKSTRQFINNINVDRKYKEKMDIRWFTIDAITNHRGFFTLKNTFATTITNNKDDILYIIEEQNIQGKTIN